MPRIFFSELLQQKQLKVTMYILVNNLLLIIGLISMNLSFIFCSPLLAFISMGHQLGSVSCSGSSFLRTGKNLITCETSVPLLNVVEIDNNFQLWTGWGGKERLLGQLPLPYFQR